MPQVCSTPRILVVDDEPQLRELLADALADLNVEVQTAASGREALQTAILDRPDLLVTDYCLGDCTGLDVIDRLRDRVGDVPAVVITGHADPATLTTASRHRPIELMTKPLDLERLRSAIREELHRQASSQRTEHRSRRLRSLARKSNIERKSIHQHLETTCADLTEAYRSLSSQLALQQIVLNYQRELLSAGNDDDVFRALFRLFVRRSGPVFGVAMVCDAQAELRMAGRFGVPYPDGVQFCQNLSAPAIEQALREPVCRVTDAGDNAEDYDPSIREFLPGISVLNLPLLPAPGEMIGLVVLYRKGEQPFTEDDTALAELIGHPTAVAVRRND